MIVLKPNRDNPWTRNTDPNIVGEFEKLVVKEVEARQKWMKGHIKRYEEKQDNNYVLIQLTKLNTRPNT